MLDTWTTRGMSYEDKLLHGLTFDIGTGCWNFTFKKPNAQGYVDLTVDKVAKKAHRISYELFKEKIPDELVIDHLCQNTICVNPEHLEAVTIKVNVQRGGNWNSFKTHCPKGHPYDLENTHSRIVEYSGGIHRQRACKTCRKVWDRIGKDKKIQERHALGKIGNRFKTECPAGHPYDAKFSGGRRCKRCDAARAREYRARKRIAR